jgi:transposase
LSKTVASYVENFLRRGTETMIAFPRGFRIQRWSYERVAATAFQFARELEARRIGKGERVLIWGENSAEWVAAFFGCLLRGVIVVPRDASSATGFVERVERQVEARLLLYDIGSSKPLSGIESVFAVDSSGLSTNRFARWIEIKYGKARTVSERDWIKVHIMCGVKTNIVTAVELSGAHGGDSPRFKPLVLATSNNFTMNEVSVDKAYSAENNLKLVQAHTAMPYIDFRSNAADKDKRSGAVWKRMYNFYQYNQEWFYEHYHKRSNAESTFSIIKAKFGGSLRSKTRTAQYNEALCKILCHNICVVIQSIYELGIEPNFWPEDQLE